MVEAAMEISKMKVGRELDALIAEKFMGWYPPSHEITNAARKRERMTHSTYDNYWCSPAHVLRHAPPPFSSDTSEGLYACRQMEEKIKEIGLAEQYTKALCELVGRPSTAPRYVELFDVVHASPLDRCRAALSMKKEVRR